MPYIFRLNSEPEGVTLDLTADAGWSPSVSYDNQDVVETIPVLLTATSDDDQAANLQALHRIQENVRYYIDEPSSQHTQETWLEWQMQDETSTVAPRRRLVKAMDVAFDQGMWFTCGEANLAHEMRVILTLRCAGWWEAKTLQTNSTDTTLTTTLMEPIVFIPGGGPIFGDAPARLEYARLSELAGAGVDDIWGAYIAFRSEKRHGTLANFVPLWELELGTAFLLGGDTAIGTQAGAGPNPANNCMETTFATVPGFATRVIIVLNQVTANYSDNYGRYIVLYRGEVDAATSCTVRVDFYTQTSVTPAQDIVGTSFTVDNSADWKLFDTGLIVQLPPMGTHTIIPIPEDYGFRVSASLDSGAGHLYSDCLVLIPIDEYLLYYVPSWLTASTKPAGYVRTYFYNGPDGSSSELQFNSVSNAIYTLDVPYTEGDGVPPGDGTWAYFVIYNGYDGENVRTSDTTVHMGVYPRYHSLMGDN